MRVHGLGLVLLLVNCVLTSYGQSVSPLLPASLTGAGSISDVTLTGTFTRIWGPDQQQGTVTLQAKGLNQARVTFASEGKTRVEVRSFLDGMPNCELVNEAGKTQALSLHNCLTDAAWFFPGLSALADQANPNLRVQDLGDADEDGLTLRHYRIYRIASRGTPAALASFSRLSTMDFFLDRTSQQPLIVRFNVHPDDDAERDIPVEMRYADYRDIGGVRVPFRIQKLLSGSVVLDIALSDAKLNTGLTDALFATN